MKKFSYLLFLFIGFTSFAQEAEKLPKIPWEDIVEMNTQGYDPIIKWNCDIHIKLEGIYTKSDSITVAKIVKKLDSLTETISIKISNREDSNLKLHFLDTLIFQGGNYNDVIYGSTNFKQGVVTKGRIYVYKIYKSDVEVQNRLEARLAKTIVTGLFYYSFIEEKRYSIFNPLKSKNNSEIPLNNEDMAIIKEVYKKGFEKRLKAAEKQFKSTVIDKLRQQKVQERDRSIWWVQNPIAILILPTLLFLLFFVFILKKINHTLSFKIKNNWVKFIIVTIIGLVFAAVLIAFYHYFYQFLRAPSKFQDQRPIVIGIYYQFLDALAVIILLPFIVFLRFIEIKIRKSSQRIFVKTTLIFLSTGILPFIIIFALQYFSGYLTSDKDYLGLSRIFLYTMAIATIRALISYFIFKERNLIIENESKLSALRELKTKAELKSLQSQINPHFLYNALNSIASLAPIDTVKTQKMAYSLSDLFKYTINREGKKMSTVSDEVTMVQNYLNIEKIRFGDRLQFTIDVDPELEKVEIPLFIIQPLVENAVKHGISKIEGEGKIALKIEKTTTGILIEVKDNGPHFPEGLVSGHGLQTVFDLLRLTYGNKATLNWQNTPDKSITVTITQNI